MGPKDAPKWARKISQNGKSKMPQYGPPKKPQKGSRKGKKGRQRRRKKALNGAPKNTTKKGSKRAKGDDDHKTSWRQDLKKGFVKSSKKGPGVGPQKGKKGPKMSPQKPLMTLWHVIPLLPTSRNKKTTMQSCKIYCCSSGGVVWGKMCLGYEGRTIYCQRKSNKLEVPNMFQSAAVMSS